MKMKETIAVTSVTMCMLATPAFSQSTTVAGFDGGADDGFTGNAFFEAAGGNPGGNAHHLALIFFNDLRTGAVGEPANPGFLGDYSSFDEVTFSVDVKTESLTDFIGNEIARPIGLKLVNHNIQGPDGDAGVFFEVGTLGVNFTPDWTTLSVTVDDPTSPDLPPGWIGFGDTNEFFEPVLPPGVTFADILADVTEFDVTGAVPGFFFTDAFFDVRIDNISVTVTAPPAAAVCLDVKPGSCPNPVNAGSRGFIPIALVGSADFDVLDVDVASLVLSRADGVGGSVMPWEGPPGPHTTIDDVATPVCGDDAEPCACTTDGADGIDDLLMHFSTWEAAAALELSDVPGGTELQLCLSGTLLDGTAFEACDCILMVPAGGPPMSLGTGSGMRARN
jgi:hypothetical protein